MYEYGVLVVILITFLNFLHGDQLSHITPFEFTIPWKSQLMETSDLLICNLWKNSTGTNLEILHHKYFEYQQYLFYCISIPTGISIQGHLGELFEINNILKSIYPFCIKQQRKESTQSNKISNSNSKKYPIECTFRWYEIFIEIMMKQLKIYLQISNDEITYELRGIAAFLTDIKVQSYVLYPITIDETLKPISNTMDLNYSKNISLIVKSFVIDSNQSLDMLRQSLLNYLIPSISIELIDLIKWNKISFLIGIEYTFQYVEQVRLICELIKAELPTIYSICVGYEIPPPVNHDDCTLVTIDPFDSVYQKLLAAAHEYFQSEYFILLTPRLRFTRSNWILYLLGPLIRDRILEELGVSYLTNNSDQTFECESLLQQTGIVARPVAIALHATHVNIFVTNVTIATITNSLFTALRSLLILDLYSIFQSSFALEFPYELMPFPSQHRETSNQSESLSSCILLNFNEYFEMVETLSWQIVNYLSSTVYKDFPIRPTTNELSYGQVGLLRDKYCETNRIGCDAEDTPTCNECSGFSTNVIDVNPPVEKNDDSCQCHPSFLYRTDNPESVQQLPVGRKTKTDTKIAFITAIFGEYEPQCRQFVRQTIPSDFICFTDLDYDGIDTNGWIIDNTPYHALDQNSRGRNDLNSITNNQHPFNVAKYYKQNFQNIETLKKYEIIVWLDGSIKIHSPNVAKLLMEGIQQKGYNILLFDHDGHSNDVYQHGGKVYQEMLASWLISECKYRCTEWNGYPHPVQLLPAQYYDYIFRFGYDDYDYWPTIYPDRLNVGLWVTCFVAFDMKNKDTHDFLSLWYEQTLRYSTQDQVSFPFVAQKLRIHPFSLPSRSMEAYGNFLHNNYFTKCVHGNINC